MRYYKVVLDGYILLVGEGHNGTEIAKSEYDEILIAVKNVPPSPSGYAAKLKEDLTWDFVPVEPPDPDPEIDETEAFNIILGI